MAATAGAVVYNIAIKTSAHPAESRASLTLGTVNWELDELEPTEVLDVYKVTLRLTWDGGDDFESGEQLLSAYVCRPSWTEGELQEDQNTLKTRKSEKIQELVESQDW